jgi:DNA gyrase subunit A
MEGKFIVMITRKGVIKKTDAMDFAKIRSTGIRALNLNEGDELAFCSISSGTDSIIIATYHGQGIHFKESEVRSMGRNAAGVRGIMLRDEDYVVGLEVIPETSDLLFATSKGYGKRVKVTDFRVAHRGGLGVRTIPCDTRNGMVIGLQRVTDESHVLLIDTNGKVIRLSPQEIRTMGRQAKGVRLVRLSDKQYLSAMLAFDYSEDESAPESGEAAVPTVGDPVLMTSPEDLLLLDENANEIVATSDVLEEPADIDELTDDAGADE